MTQPLTMYTTPWCGYCRRLKSQLAREGIELKEVDIEREPDAAEFVMTVNGGYQTVPTLLFSDGSTLTNPSMREVKRRLQELAVPLCPNSSAARKVRATIQPHRAPMRSLLLRSRPASPPTWLHWPRSAPTMPSSAGPRTAGASVTLMCRT